MDDPPLSILSCIRIVLASLFPAEDTRLILESLTWNEGTFINLKQYCSDSKKIQSLLINLVSHPEETFTEDKLAKILKFYKESKEHYELVEWKKDSFPILYNCNEIIHLLLKLLETIPKRPASEQIKQIKKPKSLVGIGLMPPKATGNRNAP